MPRNIKGKYPTYKSAATGREMRVPGMKMAQDGDPGQAFIEKANTNNVGEETKYMGNVGQDTQLSDAEIKKKYENAIKLLWASKFNEADS